MLGIDPLSVEPSSIPKPPPGLLESGSSSPKPAASEKPAASPLSSPLGSPESHVAATQQPPQQQQQQQPVTGSSIFNVFFNAGKAAATESDKAHDSSETETKTNGVAPGKRINELRVVDLKAELEKRDQPTGGNKTVLLQRLRGALEAEGADPDQVSFAIE